MANKPNELKAQRIRPNTRAGLVFLAKLHERNAVGQLHVLVSDALRREGYDPKTLEPMAPDERLDEVA